LIDPGDELRPHQALAVCRERDLVSEQVFVLGKMGNNRAALTLIIERLGDVNRVGDINFWWYFWLTSLRQSNLLGTVATMIFGRICYATQKLDRVGFQSNISSFFLTTLVVSTPHTPIAIFYNYSYMVTSPSDFIRGLLENVGPDIDPIRLIRRIRNGLEIPGLKEALIKILHDFNLQISFLEGCQTILGGDCSDLSRRLQKGQTSGYFLDSNCLQSLIVLQNADILI
jgi:vacuolar protein sorting-associated protein 41